MVTKHGKDKMSKYLFHFALWASPGSHLLHPTETGDSKKQHVTPLTDMYSFAELPKNVHVVPKSKPYLKEMRGQFDDHADQKVDDSENDKPIRGKKIQGDETKSCRAFSFKINFETAVASANRAKGTNNLYTIHTANGSDYDFPLTLRFMKQGVHEAIYWRCLAQQGDRGE